MCALNVDSRADLNIAWFIEVLYFIFCVCVCVEKKRFKKMEKKVEKKSKKVVRFDECPRVLVMHTWSWASREARRGQWEQIARDTQRFKMRIERQKDVIEPVLVKKLQLMLSDK